MGEGRAAVTSFAHLPICCRDLRLSKASAYHLVFDADNQELAAPKYGQRADCILLFVLPPLNHVVSFHHNSKMSTSFASSRALSDFLTALRSVKLHEWSP